jgi:hypothetical protein
MLPGEAQPLDRVEDGVDVFLFFLLRVGVVETHVAAAGVVSGQAEVQADRLGVADVQVAVRLGRKTGDHLGQGLAILAAALGIGTGDQVGFDDAAQGGGGGRGVTVFSSLLMDESGGMPVYSDGKHYRSCPLPRALRPFLRIFAR